jgi:hypothetical protein
VDFLKSSTSWSLLLNSGDSSGLSHHSSLSNEDYVSVREFLLELSCESVVLSRRRRGEMKRDVFLNGYNDGVSVGKVGR